SCSLSLSLPPPKNSQTVRGRRALAAPARGRPITRPRRPQKSRGSKDAIFKNPKIVASEATERGLGGSRSVASAGSGAWPRRLTERGLGGSRSVASAAHGNGDLKKTFPNT